MQFNSGSDRHQWSTRLALIAGFGAILAIFTINGLDTLRVLQKLRNDGDRLRKEYLFRNQLLNDIQSDLYLSGTYVRDYLFDPELQRAVSYRSTLENIRTDVDSALESYRLSLESDESKQYLALKVELVRYWDTLAPVLQLNPHERQQKGYAWLRNEVFPTHMMIRDIANGILDMNGRQLSRDTERNAILLSNFKDRLVVTLMMTFALIVGTATLCISTILKVKAPAHTPSNDVVDARKQLENLFAHLINEQESERRLLAQELHDEVGQALSAALVELRNLSKALAYQSEEQASPHLETIGRLVQNTVRRVRNMSLLLRPSMLDDLGLIPALRWQAREVSRLTTMDVTVSTDVVSDDFPDEYKTCIYRVVQEALRNCFSPSHATSVHISLLHNPKRLTLCIRDNGADCDLKNSNGLVLLGIEKRVMHLGGTCEILSGPGSSTAVAIELPLNALNRK